VFGGLENEWEGMNHENEGEGLRSFLKYSLWDEG